jgi:hypothetical protein
LFHDFTEAYLGDVVSGIKGKCRDYRRLEALIAAKLQSHYQIYPSKEVEAYVNSLDKSIVLDEIEGLMPDKFKLYRETVPGEYSRLYIKAVPDKDLHAVKSMFLVMCARLGIKDREEKTSV